MKKIYYLLIVLFTVVSTVGSYAQNANIRGIITDDYNNPVANVKVVLTGTVYEVLTDAAGVFNFNNIPYGDYQLEIHEADYAGVTQTFKADQQLVDIGKVTLLPEGRKNPVEEQIPTVTIDENDTSDPSGNGISSSLSASRDVFASAATFTFSVARFDVRGYEDEHFINFMNGSPMVNLVNGRSIFAWGGLNDVTRNQTTSYGLKPSSFAFGGLGGAASIDTRASRQRKQLQATYSIANRAYENRLMLTYGSGIMKGGWAFSASLSRRWAQEGYIAGTFYDGWSYYVAAEKIINTKHSISISHFGVSTINGRSTNAVKEAYELTGDNYYNPLWGYQNGEKRNSAVNNIFTPLTVLSHDWSINNKSSLTTSLSYQFGKEKRGGLNWFNAANPRGDYYRNLPSFASFAYTDPVAAAYMEAQLTEEIKNNPDKLQINWDKLYETNSLNYQTFNGVTGRRANYILENRIEDNHNIGFNTVYNNTLTDKVSITAGLGYQSQKTDYYKELDDLLGADYYVDLNQFAEQSPLPGIDAAQNDLNNPNNIITEGDEFGYNYTSDVHVTNVWIQPEYKANKIDAFIAVQMRISDFKRTGNYKNGVFAETSFGESEKKSFTNPMVKGGVSYKINGRNYIFANGAVGSRAPFFDDAFISPTLTNNIVGNIDDVKLSSIEAGYSYKSPLLKAQATIYSSAIKDLTDIFRYYNDDVNNFVNLSVSGINERHDGIEVAAEATVYKGLTISAVAAVGSHYYTSRQLATTTRDNLSTVEAKDEIIYSENYKAGAGPQSAYTLGAFYRGKQFWTFGVNVNYFDNMYARFNPVRRTVGAVEAYTEGPDRDLILDQEKFDAQMTLDIHASKSFKLKTNIHKPYRNQFIVINAGINNILNNQDFIQSGNEQLRFDFDTKRVSKFPSRYSYAFGVNYFISVILRMN